MSEPNIKKSKVDSEIPLLLFVSVPEDAVFYCWTTPLTFQMEKLIPILNLSVPSTRAGKIPGCEGVNDEFDASVWTKVEEGDVKDLTNIGKVVLGFYYE